jgi:hypothetical protein
MWTYGRMPQHRWQQRGIGDRDSQPVKHGRHHGRGVGCMPLAGKQSVRKLQQNLHCALAIILPPTRVKKGNNSEEILIKKHTKKYTKMGERTEEEE